MAADTLKRPFALHVTPADADNCAELKRLARTVQAVTNEDVDLGCFGRSYTPANAPPARVGNTASS